MDLHTRQLLDEAIALDDKTRAECECWEAKRAEREQARARTQLVYKVHEPKIAAQRQRTTSMVDREWVHNQLHALAGIIGEETGKIDAKLLAEIKTLKAEVAALKSEIEVLRQQKASKE